MPKTVREAEAYSQHGQRLRSTPIQQMASKAIKERAAWPKGPTMTFSESEVEPVSAARGGFKPSAGTAATAGLGASRKPGKFNPFKTAEEVTKALGAALVGFVRE